MLPENFLLYLQILLFLFITPGTPRILIASYSMSYGIKKSIWTALGDISANTVQMIVVTFLIGSLLLSYPNIMIVMKWLGVTYLCYLAYELFKAKVKNFDSDYLFMKEDLDDLVDLDIFIFLHSKIVHLHFHFSSDV